MAAVVPSDFIRLKYRRAAHEPELNEEDATAGKSLSMAKKVKPPEVDLTADAKNLRFKPPIMLPAHTQNTRVEKVITSDDKEYRKKTKPTLFEKMEQQKQVSKEFMNMEKAKKMAEEEKLRIREEITRMALQNEDDDNGGDDDKNDEEEKKDEVPDESAEKMYELATVHMDEEDAAEFKRIRLEQKERKLLRTRPCHEYHFPVDKWTRRRLAFKLALNLGTRTKGITEILPWLLLGPKENAQGAGQHDLINRGVTHILNITDDCQNEFPEQFVYLKIPIKDDETVPIQNEFDKALSFFNRVEEKHGKIYVHCTAGASRAAAMVVAYLVADRKISLNDAYAYVQSRRPIVMINVGFLFQLALLELKQERGCSVLYHKDWRFYEFNMIKADIDPKADWREPKGTFATTLHLYRKREDEEEDY